MDQAPSPRIPPQSPPSFNLTPDAIAAQAQALIDATNKVVETIVSTVSLDSATFETVITPLANAENTRYADSGVLRSLRTTALDEALREAARRAADVLDNFSLQLYQRADIYALVDAVRRSIDSKNSPEPGPEGRHFLESIHKEFAANGLGLPEGPLRERFTAIQRRITTLSGEFISNVDKQTKGIWFDPKELDGVPDHVVAAMEKGTGEYEGKLFLAFSTGSGWVAATATKEETRRRLYVARNNRCNDNIPIFKEVTLLRDEAARLLGYRSHAAMVLQDKMAGEPDTVYKLLGDMRDVLAPGIKGEVESWGKEKKKDMESRGEASDETVYTWDISFGTFRQEQAVGKLSIAEYLELQHTVDVMLETMGGLFRLVFTKMNKDGPVPYNVWDKNVELFSVWDTEDEGGDFVEFLYLDLYTGDFKPQGPTCRSLIAGYTRPDGSRHYPSTILFCPLRKPTDDKPTLLSHHNATQLFHELGHGIHNLVSKTAYARFHGSSGTVVDFGEMPSQLLENWLRAPSQLKRFGRHYATLSDRNLHHWREKHSTNTPVPDPHLSDEAIDHLLRRQLPLGRATYYLGEVHRSMWDMAIHDPPAREALEGMDLSETYGRLHREILAPVATAGDLGGGRGDGDATVHPYTTWTNMIDGDYHAGYYGYLLSEMYAFDVFENVFGGDVNDKEAARRLRYGLLERGGSRPEREILFEFLGRDPDAGPFRRWLIGREVE
ncbi:hypothetical protein QBC47DRAFT_445184 [Echria macrotheca]|uniref:Peptidase M3A/M3B catalytic domain-containing protein n=1 Tax=Echria macrotheca TaxID=438768 RepID=A0AAJ0BG05_9PEZI|nr:hypothetical protein QBC47DRAFT_445184 [Echria macrotheca]